MPLTLSIRSPLIRRDAAVAAAANID